MGISKPRRGTAISDCFIAQAGAPGKTQMGADLGLHHLGNPGACAPSGQLQTTLEHDHPAPAQMTLLGGWGLVVNGHSQSFQLTGLAWPIAIKAQLQGEDELSPHNGLCHWTLQDPTGHLLH